MKPTYDEIVAKVKELHEIEVRHVHKKIANGNDPASCDGAAHALADVLDFLEPKLTAEEIALNAIKEANATGCYNEDRVAAMVAKALREAGKLVEE